MSKYHFGCGILRIVLKSKNFGQKSTYSKENFSKKIGHWITVCQKVPKSYFQCHFSISKTTEFLFFFSQKSINLRGPKLFSLTSIFEPLYFLKSCPIFDKLTFIVFTKYSGFIWAHWFSAKISLKFHNRVDIDTRFSVTS